jgi:K+-sensing histidine kinase KdpD
VAKILVVDDDPINRELLRAYLDSSGHDILEAESGEQAVALARDIAPDLVLLDVMMPGMSGFAATRLLKNLAPDEFLPVVLVTALSDHASRLEGLRTGADELLTKPIDRHELMLRVANLLKLRDREAALTRRNLELVELHRFREELSAMIVHDLRNPLTAVIANLGFAIDDTQIQPDTLEALRDSKSAADRAVRLLANLLDVARLEERQLQLRRSLVPVADLVGPLVHQRQHLAGSRSISIDSAIDEAARVYVDTDLIGRVIENVFDNALRYTPQGGRIAVCGTMIPDAVRVTIGNSGAAIPVESRTHIFEKYAQLGHAVGRMNLGLGLYFCRLAAEAHGGRMWVDETADLPTVFALELPTCRS